MVMGKPDMGKSTLIQYLLKCGLQQERRVAVVDADIGQATFGPPSCLSLSFWTRPKDKEEKDPKGGDIHIEGNCNYKNLQFIGALSPVGFLLQVVVGVKRLVDQALERGVDLVLVDTSGLVQGRTGFLLKKHKIELVRPNHLIVLERREEELENILTGIPFPPGMIVSHVPRTPNTRPRSLEERRIYRAKQFSNYFQNSRARWIYFSNQRKPLPGMHPFKGMLVGLLSKTGQTLGLGMISRIGRKSLEVITPLPTLTGVQKVEPSVIGLGKDFLGKKDGKLN